VKTRIPKLEHALTTRQKDWLHMIELVNGCDLFDKSASFRPAELMAKARKKGLFDWILDKEIPEEENALRRERSMFGKLLARHNGTEFGARRLIIKGSGHYREIIIFIVLPESVQQIFNLIDSGLIYK